MMSRFTTALRVGAAFLPLLAALPAAADPSPLDASTYNFVGYQEDTLIGSISEVVFLPKGVTDPQDDNAKVVIEIPVGTKTMTPLARANEIARRLEDASQKDHEFYNNLTPSKWNHQTVVKFLGSPDNGTGLLITVDAASAKVWLKRYDRSADTAVAYLMKCFKETLQGQLRDAKFDYQLSDSEKKDRATDYLLQADKARHKKEDERVVKLLKRSIALVPDWGRPYVELCQFYLDKNDPIGAGQVVAQAKQNNVDLSDVIQTLNPGGNKGVLTLVAKAGN